MKRFAPIAAGSGVQHVEAVMRGQAEPAPLSVVPVKFFGGILAIGSGLALGREGPSVQVVATIGAWIVKRLALPDDKRVRIMQTAVAGASLGVAFTAPFWRHCFRLRKMAAPFLHEADGGPRSRPAPPESSLPGPSVATL